jgi:hypothetical protein
MRLIATQADLRCIDPLNITCAPIILITKPKFHFLVHLPLFIRRFGPAGISTERYECNPRPAYAHSPLPDSLVGPLEPSQSSSSAASCLT